MIYVPEKLVVDLLNYLECCVETNRHDPDDSTPLLKELSTLYHGPRDHLLQTWEVKVAEDPAKLEDTIILKFEAEDHEHAIEQAVSHDPSARIVAVTLCLLEEQHVPA